MYWSRLFIPTLREESSSESAALAILTRAGYVRTLSTGGCVYLTLGRRSLRKIENLIRREMEDLGAQELLFPASASHPEGMAALAKREPWSYKHLPQFWFHTTQRPPEARLIEALAFDQSAESLATLMDSVLGAVRRVMSRCGVDVFSADPADGATALLAESATGDVALWSCGEHNAFPDRADTTPAPVDPKDDARDLDPELVHTPGHKTIAEVSAFLGEPETKQIKSRVMAVDGLPVLALLRGDHMLNDAKLAMRLEAREIRPASEAEIREWFGAEPGSLGPVGLQGIRILADRALKGRRNLIAGANRTDYHLRNVTPGEDFSAEFTDLRQTQEGDACVACGRPVSRRKAVELARFETVATSIRVLTKDGKETTATAGVFSLSIDSVLRSAAERNQDGDGLVLPPAIAPFDVVITTVNASDAAQRNAAASLYGACSAQGLEALMDDRNERPGVKFKDAELIGAPYRVTVGKKLTEGRVEIMTRAGKKNEDALVDDAVGVILRLRDDSPS